MELITICWCPSRWHMRFPCSVGIPNVLLPTWDRKSFIGQLHQFVCSTPPLRFSLSLTLSLTHTHPLIFMERLTHKSLYLSLTHLLSHTHIFVYNFKTWHEACMHGLLLQLKFKECVFVWEKEREIVCVWLHKRERERETKIQPQ